MIVGRLGQPPRWPSLNILVTSLCGRYGLFPPAAAPPYKRPGTPSPESRTRNSERQTLNAERQTLKRSLVVSGSTLAYPLLCQKRS